MRIILVDKYFFIKGGAEESFFQTADLLKSKGHKVVFFSMHHPRNLKTEYEKYFVSEVDHEKQRGIKALSNAIKIIYSTEAYKKISSLIKEEKPDIAHLHNIYHQLSPSIIDALKKFRVPMVMTLHDYKLVCPSYSLFCNGRVCQKCQNKKFYHCFLSRCVKDSYLKSLVNTIEMYVHHCLWHIYDKVDVFISPSMFLKEKLKEMGFNKRIEYLPNFVRLDDFTPEYEFSENSVVYFGRLSKEKGLATLLRAMQGLPNIKLKLVGEGPMRAALEKEAENLNLKNVEFLGYKNKQELQQEIKKSMCVVLPSECYENNPRSIIEGFALGKPAVGARIGGIPELIKENQTGLLFEAGDVEDLRTKISILASQPHKIKEMGKNARQLVEKELNEEKHYAELMKIYDGVK